jgi:6,7-dimethyl-8-ribityllumazine synthase
VASPNSTRFAIVRAMFYTDLAERLTAGALRGFAEQGVGEDAVDVHDVPGAFELPLAAKACASSGRYAGVACLGAVIRGETDHYDFVCAAAAYGIELVQIETGVPCAFGVLTVDNLDQALARSGGDKRDQGYSSARTALHMVDLLSRLSDA